MNTATAHPLHGAMCKALAWKTDDEMKERITRQEKYNEKVREQKEKDREQLARRKELKRLTDHLTLEQLKVIEDIQP